MRVVRVAVSPWRRWLCIFCCDCALTYLFMIIFFAGILVRVQVFGLELFVE
jgi:hypothetical protein